MLNEQLSVSQMLAVVSSRASAILMQLLSAHLDFAYKLFKNNNARVLSISYISVYTQDFAISIELGQLTPLHSLCSANYLMSTLQPGIPETDTQLFQHTTQDQLIVQIQVGEV